MLAYLAITIVLMCTSALVVTRVALARTHRLERELRMDPLTRIGNRRAFEDLVEQGTIDGPVTLVMLDLDRFKEVNDTHGHAAGDETLRRVAAVMRSVIEERVPDAARLYRFGGDEFAIALEDLDADHARSLLDELRERMELLLLPHEKNIRVSAGLAVAPMHATEWGTLLSCSDRALYQAKRAGRNRSVLYSSEQLDEEARKDPLQLLRVLATALGAAVDARDAYTHAHSHNVADLASYIARTMELPEHEVSEIFLAGLLHDVGKIGVSDGVLKKPDVLDATEWEEVKTHCEIGYRILNSIDGAERVREMVLSHHERPDGRGYPRGLVDGEIPLGALIIAVADSFDAMTADRSYKQAMTAEEALEEIVDKRGTQFDGRVVDAICELMLYDGASDQQSGELHALEQDSVDGGSSYEPEEDGEFGAAA